MHSASSRTNSILIYTGMVLAAMCILNYLHGVYLYEAKADVHFEVVGISTFTKTEILGDGLLFHYNLEAGILQNMQT